LALLLLFSGRPFRKTFSSFQGGHPEEHQGGHPEEHSAPLFRAAIQKNILLLFLGRPFRRTFSSSF
jgi:hypothetical protein